MSSPSSSSFDSLFDANVQDEDDESQSIADLPVVYKSPPININGLHLSSKLISVELESKLLSTLSFNPPSLTQLVTFGNLSSDYKLLENELKFLLRDEIPSNTFDEVFNQPLPRQSITNVYGWNHLPSSYHLTQHTDLDKFGNGVIIVSLGNGIAFNFANRSTQFELYLPKRSILCLTDDARWIWTHGIVKRCYDNVESVGILKRNIRIGITLRFYNEQLDEIHL